MKNPASSLSRRHFLLAASAGGIAASATIASKSPRDHPRKAGAVSGSRGYHLTDHIRRYYSTTKV